jgi:hypothetical protein
MRGLEGSYLSKQGAVMKDHVNVIYTDTPASLESNIENVSRYADELRSAAALALEEEAILIVVSRIYHAE